jgi:hypothetical protein
MIDADERGVMEATVRGAIADALATAGDGTDIDAVLAKLGWLEMLHDTPDDAIGIVFGALGATNATATALDDVLAWALGREPRADLAVLLPPVAAWDAPGRLHGSDLHATGLATARAAHARELLVACTTASEAWAVVTLIASCRSLASMRKKPPICSLVSAKRPVSDRELAIPNPDNRRRGRTPEGLCDD